MAKESAEGATQPKKKMSKKRKLLIALGIMAGLLVGAWVLVVTPAINKIATEQLQAAGLEGAIVEIHADGAKITMPTLPASFGGDSGLTGTNVVFEFGGLGVDDINLLMEGANAGTFSLPKGTHFSMTADTFSEFADFSLIGTDESGTFTGTISNARAAELATVIKDGKFVGTDEGTIDSFLTGIVLTPGADGTVLTANVDMAEVLTLLSK